MPEKPDKLPLNFQLLCDRLWQENQLLANRLVWFLTIQGLLATALGVMWEKDKTLVIGISLLGILTAVSIGVGCRRANDIIDLLDKKLSSELANEWGTMYKEFIIWGPSSGDCSCLMPGKFLPKAFALG